MVRPTNGLETNPNPHQPTLMKHMNQTQPNPPGHIQKPNQPSPHITLTQTNSNHLPHYGFNPFEPIPTPQVTSILAYAFLCKLERVYIPYVSYVTVLNHMYLVRYKLNSQLEKQTCMSTS